MRRSIRLLAAGTALVAPVAVGWAYTAGATVGESGGGLSFLVSDETVDEFLVDDHLVTREGHDGQITMSVVGPDGRAVAIDDLPADLADRVDYYRSEWHPSISTEFVESGDAVCYELRESLEPDGDIEVVSGVDGVYRVLEASADGDGVVTVEAAQFDAGVLTAAERDGLEDGSLGLDDLSGGTPIEACET